MDQHLMIFVVALICLLQGGPSFADVDEAKQVREVLYSTMNNHILDLARKFNDGEKVTNLESGLADSILIFLTSGGSSEEEAMEFVNYLANCINLLPRFDYGKLTAMVDGKKVSNLEASKTYVWTSCKNMLLNEHKQMPPLKDYQKLKKMCSSVFEVSLPKVVEKKGKIVH